jgi:hypothetical protein
MSQKNEIVENSTISCDAFIRSCDGGTPSHDPDDHSNKSNRIVFRTNLINAIVKWLSSFQVTLLTSHVITTPILVDEPPAQLF